MGKNVQRYLVKHGAATVWLALCALLVTSPAYAQAVNLRFLDMSTETLHAIFDHKIWPIACACVIILEVIFFGLTKQLKHVVGIILPAIAIGVWVDRANFIQSISGFSW